MIPTRQIRVPVSRQKKRKKLLLILFARLSKCNLNLTCLDSKYASIKIRSLTYKQCLKSALPHNNDWTEFYDNRQWRRVPWDNKMTAFSIPQIVNKQMKLQRPSENKSRHTHTHIYIHICLQTYIHTYIDTCIILCGTGSWLQSGRGYSPWPKLDWIITERNGT